MTDASAPLLCLRGIAKRFGTAQVLTGVDLDVPAGQVTVLCGDNGAGKSVLVKCIAGTHEPDQGKIFWAGRRVRIRQPVASLSGGQRQSVAVAKAVMWHSKLVIMDEPTAALGVTQAAMVLDLVRALRAHGLGVLVIAHDLTDVFAVADRIAVLHGGRMAAEASVGQFDRRSVVEYMTTGHADEEATDRGLYCW